MGYASFPRPAGVLVWVHAASVGEAQSSLILIERLLAERPDIHILVSTGTVTSANLLDTRLPSKCRHQFVPVDRVSWVRRFLDHWQPDLGIWIESELWPNLITESANRGMPMVLVNGRMSAQSFKNWSKAPGLIRQLLGAFTICFGQTDAEADRLGKLGGRAVLCAGNLKSAAEPLSADLTELERLRAQIDGRPVWVAASTHAGEEVLVAAAHETIKQDRPTILTILAPRHPTRASEVTELLTGQGLTVARRTRGDTISGECDVYLVDTLGELGLFYRLSEIAFIGGSLIGDRGGHNPVEATQLQTAILHGPDMRNFATIAEALAAADGALLVEDAPSLAQAVLRLLGDDALRHRKIVAAETATHGDQTVVDRVSELILPLLPHPFLDIG